LAGLAIASCLLVGGLGVGGDDAFLIVTFAGTSFFTTFFTGAFAVFFTTFALETGLRDLAAIFDLDELFFAGLAAFFVDFAMILYLLRVLKKIGKNTGHATKQKMTGD
jgi:hypothetical protein